MKYFAIIALFFSSALLLMPASSSACGARADMNMSCCQKGDKPQMSHARTWNRMSFSLQIKNPGCGGSCHDGSCNCLASNPTPAVPLLFRLIADSPNHSDATKAHVLPGATASGFFSIWRPPKLA